MQTLVDPFEINPAFAVPEMRAPMATMSIDVDLEADLDSDIIERASLTYEHAARISSHLDSAPDSWSRVRCWCSEDY
jgi:hypothetical protein